MGQVINKGDFAKKLAEKANISQNKAGEMLNMVLDTATETLVEGDKINFVGFGKIEVVDRAARAGRNPKTGEPIHIEASKAVKFTAGKTLKDAVKK